LGEVRLLVQTLAKIQKSKTYKSKGVPASCGLGLRRTWISAWKSLRKFVTPELFQRINAIEKKIKKILR
jgi:hypothetical protein